VTTETGVLAPPGDYNRLGEALAELARSADRRLRMGEAARNHVREQFSAQRLVKDIDGLYRELIGTRSPTWTPNPQARDPKALTS
jgi:glycosyltransferase involved in cell wall biosynthesis